jgi:phosphoribosyl 1,2-cyclic phosphodiesterase
MKITIVASGSGGNASVFESGGTRILVDAGVGPRTLEHKLLETGASDGRVDAVVVTHAHGDHIGACEGFAKRWKIPVFMSESTARVAKHKGGRALRVYGAREPFAIGAFTISPLPLPHDAAQVALAISDGVRRAAIATDLGEVPPGLRSHLAGCDVILIESNHDVDMLRTGPYPGYLKKRIASARGHLSNMQTHDLLRALPNNGPLHTVVLMHLSQTNNRPEIALDVARDALRGRRVRLLAASQDGTTVVDAAALSPSSPLVPAHYRMAARTLRDAVQLSLPF